MPQGLLARDKQKGRAKGHKRERKRMKRPKNNERDPQWAGNRRAKEEKERLNKNGEKEGEFCRKRSLTGPARDWRRKRDQK